MRQTILLDQLLISYLNKDTNNLNSTENALLQNWLKENQTVMDHKWEMSESDGAMFQINKLQLLPNKCKTTKDDSLSDNGTLTKKTLPGEKTTTETPILHAQ